MKWVAIVCSWPTCSVDSKIRAIETKLKHMEQGIDDAPSWNPAVTRNNPSSSRHWPNSNHRRRPFYNRRWCHFHHTHFPRRVPYKVHGVWLKRADHTSVYCKRNSHFRYSHLHLDGSLGPFIQGYIPQLLASWCILIPQSFYWSACTQLKVAWELH